MILFLDDEINVLRSIERLFRAKKIVIHTTTNPEEALRLIKEKEVKVIVSDFRMQEVNGIEFLKKVKIIQPTTYRMILSGYADENLINSAIQNEDIHEYLLKPYDQESLINKIKTIYLDRGGDGSTNTESR